MTNNQGDSPAPGQRVCSAEHAGRISRLWGDPRDRGPRLLVAGVLVGSLILQLVLLAGRHSAPFSDMTGYDERALLLLQEHTFQTGTIYGATYHGPGYIVFLAAIYGLAGHHWWGYVVQSLLSTATLLGIYLLAKQLFSRKIAVVSLLLAVGYLPFIAYAHVLMPETLFITFLVFSTYAFVRGVSKSSRLWLCLWGFSSPWLL